VEWPAIGNTAPEKPKDPVSKLHEQLLRLKQIEIPDATKMPKMPEAAKTYEVQPDASKHMVPECKAKQHVEGNNWDEDREKRATLQAIKDVEEFEKYNQPQTLVFEPVTGKTRKSRTHDHPKTETVTVPKQKDEEIKPEIKQTKTRDEPKTPASTATTVSTRKLAIVEANDKKMATTVAAAAIATAIAAAKADANFDYHFIAPARCEIMARHASTLNSALCLLPPCLRSRLRLRYVNAPYLRGSAPVVFGVDNGETNYTEPRYAKVNVATNSQSRSRSKPQMRGEQWDPSKDASHQLRPQPRRRARNTTSRKECHHELPPLQARRRAHRASRRLMRASARALPSCRKHTCARPRPAPLAQGTSATPALVQKPAASCKVDDPKPRRCTLAISITFSERVHLELKPHTILKAMEIAACIAPPPRIHGRTDDLPKCIQIFVRKFDGAAITLDVTPLTSIADVKARIDDKAGIPAHHQRLIFEGKQLEDERTIDHYGIRAESTLHALGNLNGSGRRHGKRVRAQSASVTPPPPPLPPPPAIHHPLHPPIDNSIENVMASDRWRGARPGMIFKTGPLGTGYYKDEGPINKSDACASSSVMLLQENKHATVEYWDDPLHDFGLDAITKILGMYAETRHEEATTKPRPRDLRPGDFISSLSTSIRIVSTCDWDTIYYRLVHANIKGGTSESIEFMKKAPLETNPQVIRIMEALDVGGVHNFPNRHKTPVYPNRTLNSADPDDSIETTILGCWTQNDVYLRQCGPEGHLRSGSTVLEVDASLGFSIPTESGANLHRGPWPHADDFTGSLRHFVSIAQC